MWKSFDNLVNKRINELSSFWNYIYIFVCMCVYARCVCIYVCVRGYSISKIYIQGAFNKFLDFFCAGI